MKYDVHSEPMSSNGAPIWRWTSRSEEKLKEPFTDQFCCQPGAVSMEHNGRRFPVSFGRDASLGQHLQVIIVSTARELFIAHLMKGERLERQSSHLPARLSENSSACPQLYAGEQRPSAQSSLCSASGGVP